MTSSAERSPGRQADHEPCPGRVSGVVRHIAAGGAGQASRRRQSQARSAVSVAGIRPPAGLEELLGERERYAGPVVDDVDAYAVGCATGAEGDLGAGVAAGVGQERADDAFQESG